MRTWSPSVVRSSCTMTVSQPAGIGAPVKMRTASPPPRRHCLRRHVLDRRHVARQNTAAAETKVHLSLADDAGQARIEEVQRAGKLISARQKAKQAPHVVAVSRKDYVVNYQDDVKPVTLHT
jgi:hypothetical protein